jgi:3-carboxy-cis,cis-muconate cycloisomerase
MADLFWPGDGRSGSLFDERSLFASLVEVEQVWLRVLAEAGVAPPEAAVDLEDLLGDDDREAVTEQAEASGNPVVPLVALLRERLTTPSPEAARWLHRGLTSQDVLDTGLISCAAATRDLLTVQLTGQITTLVELIQKHRDDVMAGRTLTQHAVPITFGLKAASWLTGILDARDDLHALRFPVQIGGAAGTLAAAVELAGDADAAQFLVAETARTLELDNAPPWHTSRAPFTRYADALVRVTDAVGHIANDVLLLSRPEIGELAEKSKKGWGGSSTMPQKANPVLSVLVRRAALSAPMLAAQLHLAAAEQVDERATGGWHSEWSALSQLSRHTLTASSQAADLLAGLQVHTARMASNAGLDDLLAEQHSMADLTGAAHRSDPTTYLGAAGGIIDEVLARAAVDQEERL